MTKVNCDNFLWEKIYFQQFVWIPGTVWHHAVFPYYTWINLRMYGILRKILTHKDDSCTDS